jgi:hypothetical protein
MSLPDSAPDGLTAHGIPLKAKQQLDTLRSCAPWGNRGVFRPHELIAIGSTSDFLGLNSPWGK